MAKVTFEYSDLAPVSIEIPTDKAGLIVNEFIEAHAGPVDGTPQEKLVFLVQALKRFVVETATGNAVRKASALAAEQAAQAAAQALALD